MCCIAEIGMLVFGIIALVRGQFTLIRGKVVYGVPARIIGAICLLPLPLSFLIGFAIGFGKAVQGQQFGMQDAQKFAPIEAGLVLLVLVVALVIALATGEPARRKKRKRIENEYEYEYEDESDNRNRDLESDDLDDDDDQPPRRPDDRFQE